MVIHRPQTTGPARVVVSYRRLLLLLRTLLCGTLHGIAASRTLDELPPRSRAHYRAASGERRLVVGLSALQLSPALGHFLRADDASTVSSAEGFVAAERLRLIWTA